MFTVEFDRAANRIAIHVEGFWRREDVAPLAAAIGARAREARAVSDHFDVLVESFDFPVQANDVADMLTSAMRGGMAQTPGRCAVVVGSELNRLQAERTLVHPRLRVFRTLEAAEQWLAEAKADATPKSG